MGVVGNYTYLQVMQPVRTFFDPLRPDCGAGDEVNCESESWSMVEYVVGVESPAGISRTRPVHLSIYSYTCYKAFPFQVRGKFRQVGTKCTNSPSTFEDEVAQTLHAPWQTGISIL